ncbi:MAG TPA: TonB-dependent receptor, partial [Terriglobales bacterium]|nr:TonB-dependent receptor [Terriglobales bacterium]
MRAMVFTAATVACLLLTMPVLGQQNPRDLAQMSLEDLMNVEVTSVSKKEQKMSKTASAVFVITTEDIARSGATNIPDLLRMVPGVEVAQINSGTWAISIRGFNGQYSNKLLVLVDGRTVYTSMFSGVYWDAQGVLLSDIDRIEVIRGPGATIWGANAVNGVINIITKKASATQGGLITAGAGTYEHGFGTARYGGRLGNTVAYRVFGDGFSRNHLPGPAGSVGADDWNMAHGGFRADITASPQDSLVIEGDGHSGDAGEIASSIRSISPPVNALIPLRDHYSGWDVLSRWNHTISPRSETSLQLYFDRINRNDTTYGFGVNTFDIDFQHHVGWRSRHDFVWGLGYRRSSDATLATLRIVFNPATRATNLFSAFVQDEIAIRPDHLSLTLGTRLEHNDYTGFGFQPNVRAAWTPNDRNTFWAAFSRSERTPSRSETDIRANWAVMPGPNDLSILVGYLGSPRQKAEEENSIEGGYR